CPAMIGSDRLTLTMMCFLSRWARRLSWRETARAFQTSWECVYRSVEWFVDWGLAHRKLGGVRWIRIDEIHWGQGRRADSFLTVIYQIDRHCRRLLWVGRGRTQRTLRQGLAVLGPCAFGKRARTQKRARAGRRAAVGATADSGVRGERAGAAQLESSPSF